MASKAAAAASTEGEGRRAIHAFTSFAAHDRWHEFALEQGVSVSALLESFSEVLDMFDPDAPNTTPAELRSRIAGLVKNARRIDGDRRRRGGSPKRS